MITKINLHLSYPEIALSMLEVNFALHSTAIMGGSKCRVLHKSQYDACLRCRNLDHKKLKRMPDLAQEFFNSSTAAEAKAIASRVPNYLHRHWHKIKICVMR